MCTQTYIHLWASCLAEMIENMKTLKNIGPIWWWNIQHTTNNIGAILELMKNSKAGENNARKFYVIGGTVFNQCI